MRRARIARWLRLAILRLLPAAPRLCGGAWPEQWRSPEPRAAYDVVIVGAGGHGLATAYYLASEHGIRNVAVLDKGWLGGGNTGRNTTIIRSNYLWDESAAIYEHALKLWEGLSQELNYNVMYSPRGVMMLAHNRSRRAGVPAPRACQPAARHRQRMADAGAGEGLLPAAEYRPTTCAIRCWAPRCNGAAAWRGMTRSPGVTRARASALGVDIIQNCEVTGINRGADGAVTGVRDHARADRARGRSAWSPPAIPAC